MCLVVQHFFLLFVECINGEQAFPFDLVQVVQAVRKHVFFYISEIAVYATELIAEFLPDLFRRLSAPLVELEETAPGYLAVGPRLCFWFAERAEQ